MSGRLGPVSQRLAWLTGLALAAGLWFGAIPAVTGSLVEPHRHIKLDPALVDVAALLMNIAFLGALVGMTALRRRAERRAEEPS